MILYLSGDLVMSLSMRPRQHSLQASLAGQLTHSVLLRVGDCLLLELTRMDSLVRGIAIMRRAHATCQFQNRSWQLRVEMHTRLC